MSLQQITPMDRIMIFRNTILSGVLVAMFGTVAAHAKSKSANSPISLERRNSIARHDSSGELTVPGCGVVIDKQNGITVTYPGVKQGTTTNSIFIGIGAGAAYPATSPGDPTSYGAIGIGAYSLSSLAANGIEATCVGVWSCQFVTSGGATGFGMHTLGSEISADGDTAIGNDAMRDAISEDGLVTALGAAALKNGNPQPGVVAVGSQAMLGTSGGVIFSGTPTVGGVVTVTITSANAPVGVTGLPSASSYTIKSGDTLFAIADALATSLTQTINGPSYFYYAQAADLPDGTAAIAGQFPGSSTTGWNLIFTTTITGSPSLVATSQTGTSETEDTAVGFEALRAPAGESLVRDTAVGYQAGNFCMTCSYDTFLGDRAGANETTGNYATVVGAYSLMNAATASANTVIGANSADALTTGSRNIVIGASDAATLVTGNNNILVGGSNTADVPMAAASNYINIGGAIIETATTPTIASGFGTGAGLVAGASTAAFTVNVGTGGTATTGVITMGANAAPHGWACDAEDITNPASFVEAVLPTSTKTVTVQNYSRTTGLTTAWTTSDVIQLKCSGY